MSDIFSTIPKPALKGSFLNRKKCLPPQTKTVTRLSGIVSLHCNVDTGTALRPAGQRVSTIIIILKN